jgi:hypothetical protein
LYARLMHLLFVQLLMLTILHNLYIIPRSVELARFIPIHLEVMSIHPDSNLYQHFSIYLNHLFLAVFVSCVTPQIYYQFFLFQYLFLEEDRNFHFFFLVSSLCFIGRRLLGIFMLPRWDGVIPRVIENARSFYLQCMI